MMGFSELKGTLQDLGSILLEGGYSTSGLITREARSLDCGACGVIVYLGTTTGAYGSYADYDSNEKGMVSQLYGDHSFSS